MVGRRIVSDRQMEMLVEFLERNRDLAVGHVGVQGPQGRTDIKRRWDELATTLNAVGAGASKSGDKWREFWCDKKYAARKKATELLHHGRGTGGGPPRKNSLTPLEERILAILGKVAVAGNECVRIPFTVPLLAQDNPLRSTLPSEAVPRSSIYPPTCAPTMFSAYPVPRYASTSDSDYRHTNEEMRVGRARRTAAPETSSMDNIPCNAPSQPQEDPLRSAVPSEAVPRSCLYARTCAPTVFSAFPEPRYISTSSPNHQHHAYEGIRVCRPQPTAISTRDITRLDHPYDESPFLESAPPSPSPPAAPSPTAPAAQSPRAPAAQSPSSPASLPSPVVLQVLGQGRGRSRGCARGRTRVRSQIYENVPQWATEMEERRLAVEEAHANAIERLATATSEMRDQLVHETRAIRTLMEDILRGIMRTPN